MKEARVDELATILSPLLRPTTIPTIRLILSFMTKSEIHIRKQLITVCRSCSIPIINTTLYSKCSQLLARLDEEPWKDTLLSLCIDPLTSGLFISLAISLPMSDQVINESYTSMLRKEMLVMETSPLPQSINYSCFFGDYKRPLHPTLDANPQQAARIHSIIDQWVDYMTSKPHILPHITSKLVAKPTQKKLSTSHPDYLTFEEDGATQADLEYIYMTRGDLLEGGECEIKQRWYSSGITPRTYYAAGSDAYHKSKYLRDGLNHLCDLLPPTERFSRVNARRIVLSSPESHAIIYDLTSFTSNMHEQRHFLDRLSSYCTGKTVRILDAVEGLIEADLGELLSSYNDLNKQPRYGSDSLLGPDLILSHHVAGFLGVYGNLATCTFLHGAVMSCLVHTFQQLGVAGDDGVIDSYDDWVTFFAIRLLGLAEDSKGYSTNEDGNQVYLKRPIKQVGSRLYLESFALYSMIDHLFPVENDDRRFFRTPRSELKRKSSLASSVVSYLRSLTRLVINDDQLMSVRDFLKMVYTMNGFPEHGHIPYLITNHGSHQSTLPSTLIPTLESIGKDPIEYTIKSLYPGVVALPRCVTERIPLDSDLLFAGSEFECTGAGVLSYYRKLGFVELLQEDEVYTGETGLNMLLGHYSGDRGFPLYVVSVVKDVPTHLLL